MVYKDKFALFTKKLNGSNIKSKFYYDGCYKEEVKKNKIREYDMKLALLIALIATSLISTSVYARDADGKCSLNELWRGEVDCGVVWGTVFPDHTYNRVRHDFLYWSTFEAAEVPNLTNDEATPTYCIVSNRHDKFGVPISIEWQVDETPAKIYVVIDAVGNFNRDSTLRFMFTLRSGGYSGAAMKAFGYSTDYNQLYVSLDNWDLKWLLDNIEVSTTFKIRIDTTDVGEIKLEGIKRAIDEWSRCTVRLMGN